MYLGIDLGTSNSAVVGNTGGELRLFKTKEDKDTLPSVVMADRGGGRYVGERAYRQLQTAPNQVAARFKRLLGTSSTLPFGRDGSITPEEASTEVLRTLRSQVDAALGTVEVEGAVVTVPAAFNQLQSEATVRAAQAAGLDRVALLQEPVAAGLAAMERSDAKTGLFLVYDLGGGTFDVALVRAVDGAVSIEAHEGINMLGGSDFDRMLVDTHVRPWLSREFELPGGQSDPAMKRLLALARAAAEQAKIELSTAGEAVIFVGEEEARLTDTAGKDVYLEVTIARGDLGREPIKVVAARMACQTRFVEGRMDEAAFLEREFELDGGGLTVRFYAPLRAPGGEFQCRYSVGWPEREVRRYACGLDGVQALMLAMRTVHTELVESDAYKAGLLTWCDQADLDLPPTWGGGSLYDVPPQPDGDVPPGSA